MAALTFLFTSLGSILRSGASLKVTSNPLKKRIPFCRSIYETKVMKLLAFIFEQPSYASSMDLRSDTMDPECYVAPGFERVADVFRQNIKDGVDKGGSFCAYHKGVLVVNIWGGLADVENKRPWRKDTLSVFWSTTKGISSLVVGHLVDRGLLDYKEKICKYWPEFAQNGKENVTIEHLMLHSCGLVQLDGEWSFKEYADEYPKFEKRMAEQEPYWKPGKEEFGYHGLTFALYIDALVRKVDPKKRSLAQYFDEEFAKPLGLDFYIGLPPEKFDRGTKLTLYDEKISMAELFKGLMERSNEEYHKRSMAHKSPTDLIHGIDHMNKPENRRIPCGSSHGSGTAESVAKLYGILANGGKYGEQQVLSPETISALEEVAMTGVDQMLGVKVQRGMGSWLIPVVVNDDFDKPINLYGTPGLGGQFGYGDNSAKLGVAYTTNFLNMDMAEFDENDPRFHKYLDAVYICLSTIEGTDTKRQIFPNYGVFEKAKEELKK